MALDLRLGSRGIAVGSIGASFRISTLHTIDKMWKVMALHCECGSSTDCIHLTDIYKRIRLVDFISQGTATLTVAIPVFPYKGKSMVYVPIDLTLIGDYVHPVIHARNLGSITLAWVHQNESFRVLRRVLLDELFFQASNPGECASNLHEGRSAVERGFTLRSGSRYLLNDEAMFITTGRCCECEARELILDKKNRKQKMKEIL